MMSVSRRFLAVVAFLCTSRTVAGLQFRKPFSKNNIFKPSKQQQRLPFALTLSRRSYRILDQDDEQARKRTKMPTFRTIRTRRQTSSDEQARKRIKISAFRMIRTRRRRSRNIRNIRKKRKNTNDYHHNQQEEGVSTINVPESSARSTNGTPSPPVQEMRDTEKKTNAITNVHELRSAILDEGKQLKELENLSEEASISIQEMLNHDVIQLISQRYSASSMPGNRHENDTAKLALSIEGGGMRGAVSAGMAAAIASLGLCNVFDAIYGSSAGSVVGCYMITRQMCVDVYTDILPAAQDKFVCKKRLIKSIGWNAVDQAIGTSKASTLHPGMNISFVLDAIMNEDTGGLRPIDMNAFQSNNEKQPLRVASSSVRRDTGKLESLCFGIQDFFNTTNTTAAKQVDGTTSNREGLFACLQASMTVPGATGPPVDMVLKKGGNDNNQDHDNTVTSCFDAFCFEPLPYRSAVEEGATHVLVLRSRPEGFRALTKPSLYETTVTPNYFMSHGAPTVANFFKQGGQQYIYLEDLLTLEEGRNAGIKNTPEDQHKDGILVPPTKIFYGVENDDDAIEMKDRKNWNRAHLLPILVPEGEKELPVLEQDKDEVLTAVRGGFAAAFDLLAPIVIGLDNNMPMSGDRVSQLMFPNIHNYDDTISSERILETQLSVEGNPIITTSSKGQGDRMASTTKKSRRKRDAVRGLFGRAFLIGKGRRNEGKEDEGGMNKIHKYAAEDLDVGRITTSAISPSFSSSSTTTNDSERCHRTDAEALLSLLPGIQEVPNLAGGLHYIKEQTLWKP